MPIRTGHTSGARSPRLEWGRERLHPRFIVTDLSGEPRALYDGLYCQRGEAENRIKEAQVGLFVTRTSCHVLRSKHAGRNGQPADCRENIRIKDLRKQNRNRAAV